MRLRVYAKINQGIRGAEWESETSWQRRLPFAAHPLLPPATPHASCPPVSPL